MATQLTDRGHLEAVEWPIEAWPAGLEAVVWPIEARPAGLEATNRSCTKLLIVVD